MLLYYYDTYYNKLAYKIVRIYIKKPLEVKVINIK